MRKFHVTAVFMACTLATVVLFQNCSSGFRTVAGDLVASKSALPRGAPTLFAMESITLPSTPEASPDHNPPFDQFQNPSKSLYYVYPYTMRTNFAAGLAPQTWRLMIIENEYLKCEILPDLGGRLRTCWDKISKREMFYTNSSMKKNWVALRGSWVAGGLESNFPTGHSWVSSSPVDFAMQSNGDGSVSAWVANIDRVTGMQWRSEFVLRPGVSMLEQKVTLENRSDFRQPYYWWANAAVRVLDRGDRFVLPTHLAILHGSTEAIETWPKDVNGRDLSLNINPAEGAGFFALNTRENYFGAYQPTIRGGLVHIADPELVPGKKTWTWGTARWQMDNLAIDGASYIEVQGGATPNQMTHFFLEPQQTKSFTEYWLPVRDLTTVSKASAFGILSIARNSGINPSESVRLEFQPSSILPGAQVQVLSNGQTLLSVTKNLDPSLNETFSFSANNPLTFRLRDDKGTLLFEHIEGTIDALGKESAKLGVVPEPSWKNPTSEVDYIKLTEFEESHSNYDRALSLYDQGLALYGTSSDLRMRKGRLLALLSNPQSSEVLALAGTTTEAMYYRALANSDSNLLQSLQNDPTFGLASTIRLAEIQAAAGKHQLALATIQRTGEARVRGTRIGAIEVALLRKVGDLAKLRTRLSYWLAIDPTNTSFRYEAMLLGKRDISLIKHLSSDAERILVLVNQYLALGQYTEALQILEESFSTPPENEREPGVPLPVLHPMIWYYRAYCKSRLGLDFQTELRTASELSVRWVFVNSATAERVLLSALESNSRDSNARWLLGLNLLYMRRTDQAIAAFEQVRRLSPGTPALHRTLGRVYLDIKKDRTRASEVLNEGLRYEPSNPDLLKALEELRR